MTKDGWGSEWPEKAYRPRSEWDKDVASLDWPKPKDDWLTYTSDVASENSGLSGINWVADAGHDKTPWPKSPELTGMDMATGDRTVLTTFENDGIKHKVISQTELKQGFNYPAVSKAIGDLVEANYDTSKFKQQGSNLVDDQAYLYFQCEGCNDILDPHTKSFKMLQDKRAEAGWHVKWNLTGMGYKVYCAKCGEKV